MNTIDWLVAHSNMSIWRVRFWGKSYGYQAADEKLEGLKVTWKSLSGGTDGWVSRRFDKALSSATLLSMITLSANQFSIDDAHCTKLAHFFINFQFLNHCSQLTWVLNASQFSFAAVQLCRHFSVKSKSQSLLFTSIGSSVFDVLFRIFILTYSTKVFTIIPMILVSAYFHGFIPEVRQTGSWWDSLFSMPRKFHTAAVPAPT